ncbi:MAG: hypothetical protein HYV39_03060 [Candidatus Levybacteria bacterium]|nr:hypothetical protein [Candidatus Levybacteria bacterium]
MIDGKILIVGLKVGTAVTRQPPPTPTPPHPVPTGTPLTQVQPVGIGLFVGVLVIHPLEPQITFEGIGIEVGLFVGVLVIHPLEPQITFEGIGFEVGGLGLFTGVFVDGGLVGGLFVGVPSSTQR